MTRGRLGASIPVRKTPSPFPVPTRGTYRGTSVIPERSGRMRYVLCWRLEELSVLSSLLVLPGGRVSNCCKVLIKRTEASASSNRRERHTAYITVKEYSGWLEGLLFPGLGAQEAAATSSEGASRAEPPFYPRVSTVNRQNWAIKYCRGFYRLIFCRLQQVHRNCRSTTLRLP